MDRSQLLNDAEQSLRLALDGRQVQVWTAMPGIVQSVNFAQMTCVVQPAIQAVIADETGATQVVNLPLLLDVPIVFPSGGGFTITFPLTEGDEVLVVFASRCIDAWWQSGGVQPPMEFRLHDLSDGCAIPGPKSLPRVIGGISATNLQIRTDTGNCLIEMTPSGGINLISPAGISVTGNILVTGNLNVTGTSEVDGVPFSTHVHSGVTTGSSDTGPPV